MLTKKGNKLSDLLHFRLTTVETPQIPRRYMLTIELPSALADAMRHATGYDVFRFTEMDYAALAEDVPVWIAADTRAKASRTFEKLINQVENHREHLANAVASIIATTYGLHNPRPKMVVTGDAFDKAVREKASALAQAEIEHAAQDAARQAKLTLLAAIPTAQLRQWASSLGLDAKGKDVDHLKEEMLEKL